MRLNNINLNRLRAFHVVHDLRGVRSAAEKLHVTPGAVSTAIKTLEGELGKDLFIRVGHDLVPTRAAKMLFATVCGELGELDETLARLEGDDVLDGTLRVGAPNGFGVQQVVPHIAAFSARHPESRFVLRLGTPDRLVPLLRKGDLDMVVVPRRVATSSSAPWLTITTLPFGYAPRLVCSADTWNEHLRRRRSYARFIALPHVALWDGRRRIIDWYGKNFRRKPAITVALEVDNLFAAISAVMRGPWLAVLPDDCVVEQLAARELIDLHPKQKQRQQPYALLRLAGRPQFAIERHFVEQLMSIKGLLSAIR